MTYPNENLYDELFKRNADQYKFDWLFLKAQVKQESQFNPVAVSKVGAKGLSQFMPKTWREWSHSLNKPDADPFNPEDSIYFQAAYMSWLRKVVYTHLSEQYREDLLEWTLAAYNWGVGNVLRMLNKGIQFDNGLFPDETYHYVKIILLYYSQYLEITH